MKRRYLIITVREVVPPEGDLLWKDSLDIDMLGDDPTGEARAAIGEWITYLIRGDHGSKSRTPEEGAEDDSDLGDASS